MKQISRMILLMLVIILSMPVLPTMAAEGQLVVAPRQFDTGIVDEGRVITTAATIENKGSNVVEITNIRTN
jgi:hypothetical protein